MHLDSRTYNEQAEFGVLTLATKDDYRKAIGLVQSVRKTNSSLPTAIACSKWIADKVSYYFDYVIDEYSELKGFQHKLYLDYYSPFKNTLFLDADVLIFRDLGHIFDEWRGHYYTAQGNYVKTGYSSFGLDRALVLKKINKKRLVCLGGAGHAYFEKPNCAEVFNLARSIMNNYAHYANKCKFADEDVMGIAMTMLNLPPMDTKGFWARHMHAKPGTFQADALKPQCSFVDRVTGEYVNPVMVHFACLDSPFLYHSCLEKLRRESGLHPSFLWLRDASIEFYKKELFWKIKKILRSFCCWPKQGSSKN
ncbi:hypothetical protein [Desulfogranum marinum]|uniref:hypothetical protein n=1 Tax=Desulfogranum marinum TaxID=453220 RepID=UPI00196451D5|nr:hypothetical protein [Desulfogranum marinum]MBM9514822.1 hypothetical protein [Desulfogranum marinum]